MMKFLLTCLSLLLLCGGCLSQEQAAVDLRPIGPNGQRLNRIEGTSPLAIPKGMPDAQVLDCVEKAIEGPGEKEGQKNYRKSQWHLEKRDVNNKWIQLGFTVRRHYLQVCYRIEKGLLIPDVPHSVNLKQNGTKIHRKVPVWIESLYPLIQSQFYKAEKAMQAK